MIYGPNTEAVQSVIDRIPALTEDECKQLAAVWSAAYYAADDAAWYAAWGAAEGAARVAAYNAANDAAYNAARGAAWYASRAAVLATVTYDLATIDGPYTIAQRDLLMTPWIEVCGMPDGLIATAVLAGEG